MSYDYKNLLQDDASLLDFRLNGSHYQPGINFTSKHLNSMNSNFNSNSSKDTLKIHNGHCNMNNTVINGPDFIFDPNELIQEITLIPANEIAKQITLIDWDIFKTITLEEFVLAALEPKSKRRDPDSGIARFTNQFNVISFWVIDEILKVTAVKRRATCISYFIKLAKNLHALNDIHSEYAVLSALRSASIFRLEATWNLVPKKHKVQLEKMLKLYSETDNHANLRHYLNTLKLPCIPYTGVYVTDLVYINQVKDVSRSATNSPSRLSFRRSNRANINSLFPNTHNSNHNNTNNGNGNNIKYLNAKNVMNKMPASLRRRPNEPRDVTDCLLLNDDSSRNNEIRAVEILNKIGNGKNANAGISNDHNNTNKDKIYDHNKTNAIFLSSLFSSRTRQSQVDHILRILSECQTSNYDALKPNPLLAEYFAVLAARHLSYNANNNPVKYTVNNGRTAKITGNGFCYSNNRGNINSTNKNYKQLENELYKRSLLLEPGALPLSNGLNNSPIGGLRANIPIGNPNKPSTLNANNNGIPSPLKEKPPRPYRPVFLGGNIQNTGRPNGAMDKNYHYVEKPGHQHSNQQPPVTPITSIFDYNSPALKCLPLYLFGVGGASKRANDSSLADDSIDSTIRQGGPELSEKLKEQTNQTEAQHLYSESRSHLKIGLDNSNLLYSPAIFNVYQDGGDDMELATKERSDSLPSISDSNSSPSSILEPSLPFSAKNVVLDDKPYMFDYAENIPATLGRSPKHIASTFAAPHREFQNVIEEFKARTGGAALRQNDMRHQQSAKSNYGFDDVKSTTITPHDGLKPSAVINNCARMYSSDVPNRYNSIRQQITDVSYRPFENGSSSPLYVNRDMFTRSNIQATLPQSRGPTLLDERFLAPALDNLLLDGLSIQGGDVTNDYRDNNNNFKCPGTDKRHPLKYISPDSNGRNRRNTANLPPLKADQQLYRFYRVNNTTQARSILHQKESPVNVIAGCVEPNKTLVALDSRTALLSGEEITLGTRQQDLPIYRDNSYMANGFVSKGKTRDDSNITSRPISRHFGGDFASLPRRRRQSGGLYKVSPASFVPITTIPENMQDNSISTAINNSAYPLIENSFAGNGTRFKKPSNPSKPVPAFKQFLRQPNIPSRPKRLDGERCETRSNSNSGGKKPSLQERFTEWMASYFIHDVEPISQSHFPALSLPTPPPPIPSSDFVYADGRTPLTYYPSSSSAYCYQDDRVFQYADDINIPHIAPRLNQRAFDALSTSTLIQPNNMGQPEPSSLPGRIINDHFNPCVTNDCHFDSNYYISPQGSTRHSNHQQAVGPDYLLSSTEPPPIYVTNPVLDYPVDDNLIYPSQHLSSYQFFSDPLQTKYPSNPSPLTYSHALFNGDDQSETYFANYYQPQGLHPSSLNNSNLIDFENTTSQAACFDSYARDKDSRNSFVGPCNTAMTSNILSNNNHNSSFFSPVPMSTKSNSYRDCNYNNINIDYPNKNAPLNLLAPGTLSTFSPHTTNHRSSFDGCFPSADWGFRPVKEKNEWFELRQYWQIKMITYANENVDDTATTHAKIDLASRTQPQWRTYLIELTPYELRMQRLKANDIVPHIEKDNLTPGDRSKTPDEPPAVYAFTDPAEGFMYNSNLKFCNLFKHLPRNELAYLVSDKPIVNTWALIHRKKNTIYMFYHPDIAVCNLWKRHLTHIFCQ